MYACGSVEHRTSSSSHSVGLALNARIGQRHTAALPAVSCAYVSEYHDMTTPGWERESGASSRVDGKGPGGVM